MNACHTSWARSHEGLKTKRFKAEDFVRDGAHEQLVSLENHENSSHPFGAENV